MFDDLVGKSYDEVGRCYGLCRMVCARLGIPLPPMDDVSEDMAAEEIERRRHMFNPVARGEQQPGDLVHIVNFGGPPHVGVMISRRRMLHVTADHRVHGMSLNHIWIRTRIAGIYRYAA